MEPGETIVILADIVTFRPITTLIVLKEILIGQIIIPLDQRFVSILKEFFLKMILIKFAYSRLKSSIFLLKKVFGRLLLTSHRLTKPIL